MKVRFCLTLPEFFKLPQDKIAVEVGAVTGLVYFTHKGRVLAIAESASNKES